MPLISIIVPVYNVEKYLSGCIDSILSQAYRNFELILIDDGSPDRSPWICDEYALQDSRVQVIHQQNMGQSVARNRGIKAAVGEYVWFVDSDDRISPDCLEILVDEVVRNQLDVLWFDHRLVDESGTELPKPDCDDKNGLSTSVYDGELFFTDVFRMSCMPCMFLFKKAVIVELGMTFFPGIYLEDMLFTCQILPKVRRIKYMPITAYNYLIRGNSTMRNEKLQIKRCFDALIVCRELKNYYTEQPFRKKTVRKFKDVISSTVLYYARFCLPLDKQSEYTEKLREYDLLPLPGRLKMVSNLLVLLFNLSPEFFFKLCRR